MKVNGLVCANARRPTTDGRLFNQMKILKNGILSLIAKCQVFPKPVTYNYKN